LSLASARWHLKQADWHKRRRRPWHSGGSRWHWLQWRWHLAQVTISEIIQLTFIKHKDKIAANVVAHNGFLRRLRAR
jgi:hypothetical protein